MDLSKIASVTAGKTKTSGISPFSELEISKVYPNPDQPRKTFTDIEDLAATIKEHGLLQPITVLKKDDGYMIISGERRYKAHLHNEAKTIKAYILDTTDEKVEELTLIENIQRNDLTDFETAKHIVKLWETGRYEKKSDLAKKLGKSDSYISKAFSSLKLDDDILEDIEQSKKDIPLSVMDEISRVKDKTVQKEVYKKYSDGEITRDDIKEYKEPIGLRTQYFGTFSFVYNYRMLTELNFLLDGRCYEPFSENKTYYCIIEQINKEQEIIQSLDNLQFTLKTSKKNLNALKELGKGWIKVSEELLENKIYRFSIELSRYQNIQEPKDEIKTKRKLLNTFIYKEPLRWEDGTTLQSEFVDKNLPFENINIIGRGYYGNRGAFCFDDINASFSFHNIKIGDHMMTSDPNEKYNLTITKVEELEDDLLLENELSITGEVHPESFSCLEFKQINAYFYYYNLSNPEDFQGFKKGERYKLTLKKISEKFPAGNLEASFKVDDLVKDEQLTTENIAKTFEKIVDYGTVDDFEYSLKFDYIEANFYFTNAKKGLTPTFKKDKKYKITIEEV